MIRPQERSLLATGVGGDGVAEGPSRKTSFATADAAALRAIALYELFKALLVVGAGITSLVLMRHDLEGAATHALRHLHLDPASRFSLAILHMALRVQEFDPRWIALGCVIYASVRMAEAYGLWTAQAWGEWLGALSGAAYLPLELRSIIERVTALHVVVLIANIVIVLFLCWRLWRRRRAAHSRVAEVPSATEVAATGAPAASDEHP